MCQVPAWVLEARLVMSRVSAVIETFMVQVVAWPAVVHCGAAVSQRSALSA